jgi:hypothetical protein
MAGEISFRLRIAPTGNRETRHVVVGLSVGPDVQLEMQFQPTTRRSTISSRVLRDLQGRGLLPLEDRATWLLRDLRIDRQSVPNLEVRLGLTANVFDLDGILGTDFLRPFSQCPGFF